MIIFQRVFELQSGYEYALKSIEGEITQKVLKRGLSFLYATHRLDLFYITEVSLKYSKRFSSYRAGT